MMLENEFYQLIRSIKCPPYDIQPMVPTRASERGARAWDGKLGFIITVRVPDRHTGQEKSVHIREDIAASIATPRLVIEKIRLTLVEMAIHEIEEMLIVDGERLFDPHAKKAIEDLRKDRERYESIVTSSNN